MEYLVLLFPLACGLALCLLWRKLRRCGVITHETAPADEFIGYQGERGRMYRFNDSKIVIF